MRALDETVAMLPRELGFAVVLQGGDVAKDLEPLRIELCDPATGPDLPNRMLKEKSADNADAHRFVRRGRRRKLDFTVTCRHDPRGETAEHGLQVTVAMALV